MAGRKPTVSDAEILSTFLATDDPVLTTPEVRDAIGFASNPGTLKRLKQLASDGHLDHKLSGNIQIWWLTREGREYVRSQLDEDLS